MIQKDVERARANIINVLLRLLKLTRLINSIRSVDLYKKVKKILKWSVIDNIFSAYNIKSGKRRPRPVPNKLTYKYLKGKCEL